MDKKRKLISTLCCIASVCLFAGIYCLNRTQNTILLVLGIVFMVAMLFSIYAAVRTYKNMQKTGRRK